MSKNRKDQDGLDLGTEFDREYAPRKVGQKELGLIKKAKAKLSSALSFLADTERAAKDARESSKFRATYAPVVSAIQSANGAVSAGSAGEELAKSVTRVAEASAEATVRVDVAERMLNDVKDIVRDVTEFQFDVAGTLSNFAYTLMCAGIVPSGDMQKDLAAGKIFIGNGNGIDVKQALIDLLILRSAQMVERRGTGEGEPGAKILDRLYDKDPEVTLLVMERGMSIKFDKVTKDPQANTITFSGMKAVYTVRGDETHVWGRPPALPATLDGLTSAMVRGSIWEKLEDAFPGAKAGTVIEANMQNVVLPLTPPTPLTEAEYVRDIIAMLTADAPKFGRWNAIRATHDVASIAAVAGVLGLQGAYNSALLNVAPFFSESITGLIRSFTGADSKIMDAGVRSISG